MGREDFGYCSDDPNYLKLIGVVVGKNTDAKREKTLLIYSERCLVSRKIGVVKFFQKNQFPKMTARAVQIVSIGSSEYISRFGI